MMKRHTITSRAVSCALGLLVSATCLQARDIVGKLADPHGLPVAGANVTIAGSDLVAVSDRVGAFVLAGAPDAPITVRVTAAHFQPVEVEVATDETDLLIEVREFKSGVATIDVVATLEDLRTMIPGSLHVISHDDLVASKPIDANEVLRRVPGLHLREDSGPVAMRLNIGMRGLNPNRSRKVLMLEDGMPIALAPYGEPDMYYSPPIERMSRVEILKGSGQIVHGPQTVGGVVNFVTPEPPAKFHGELDVEGGQRDRFVGWAKVGSSNRSQSIGWVMTYLHKQGDGWRQFYYDIEDGQVKFNLHPSERHGIAIKAGVYDEVSNSTYLGITTPMYESDPNQTQCLRMP